MPALLRRTRYSFLAVIISFFTLITGCATEKTLPIWQAGDEFVALANRDDPGSGQGGPNHHPVSLSSRDLRVALATLAVELPGDAKPTTLFGDAELDVLSGQLHAGLERAGKDQDLVFAILGARPLSKAFGTIPVVTTGRVFYGDEGLNLILGMVRADLHGHDRRLDPFVPGSRLRPATLPGPVLLGSKEAPHAPNRPDWLVLPVGAEVKGEAAKENTTTQGAAAHAPAQELPQGNIQAAPPAAAAARKIEDRLMVLDELKAKGVITDEEYRAKRKSILNEL